MSYRYRVAPLELLEDDESTDSGASVLTRYKLWLYDVRTGAVRLCHMLSHDASLDDSVLAEKISKERLRLVDLLWVEKAVLIVDYLQLYNILWQCAQAYPWPTLWMRWTQWTAVANIDAFSLTDTGTTLGLEKHLGIPDYGGNSNYLYYAFSYALVQSAFVFAFAYYKLVVCREYGNVLARFEGLVGRIAGLVLQLLYLPTSLAVLRLFVCSDGVLAADPSVTCLSSSHLAYTITSSLLLAPSFFAVPYLLYRHIRQSACYLSDEDHEKKLQSIELRYILDFDSDWLDSQLWTSSSFTRRGMYFSLHVMCLKTTYLLLYICGRDDKATQGILLWVATAAMCAHYCCLHPPFRCGSSNVVMFLLMGTLFVNSTFALFNSCKVDNAVFVDSTESVILLAFNLAACLLLLVAAGVLLFYSAIASTPSLFLLSDLLDAITCMSSPISNRRFRSSLQLDSWPIKRTLRRMGNDPRVRSHLLAWVEAIASGVRRRHRFTITATAVTSITGLDAEIQSLRRHWIAAKALGSLFEVVLTDLIETMIVLYSRRFTSAVVRANENVVESDIDFLGATYDRYVNSSGKVLMSDRKRRLLFKLVAMGMFLSRTLCNRVNKVLEAVSRHYDFEQAQLSSLSDREREEFLAAKSASREEWGLQRARGASVDADEEAPTLGAVERAARAISEDAMKYSAAINGCLHSLDKNTEETINAFVRTTSGGAEANEVPAQLLADMETMLLYWESLLTLHENPALNFTRERFGRFKVDPEAWYTYRNSLRTYLSRFDSHSNSTDGDEEEEVVGVEAREPPSPLFHRSSSSLGLGREALAAASDMSRQASVARVYTM